MGLLVQRSKFFFVNLLGDDVTDRWCFLGVYLVILLAYFWCYMTLRMTPKWYYIPLNTMGFLLWYLKWQDHLCGKSTWPAKRIPLGCYFQFNMSVSK